jgi:hypothetical protein
MLSSQIDLRSYLQDKFYLSYDNEYLQVKDVKVISVPIFRFLQVFTFIVYTDYFHTEFYFIEFNHNGEWYILNCDTFQDDERFNLVKIDYNNLKFTRMNLLLNYSEFDEMKKYKAYFIIDIVKDLFHEYIKNDNLEIR